MEHVLNNVKIVALCVSGGKDSAVSASVAMETLKQLNYRGKVVMLYAHTPLAVNENLEYVKRLADYLGVELVVVQPPKGHGLEYIKVAGIPTPWRRWCMHRWKLEPMLEWAKKQPKPLMFVIGIRVSESQRRFTVYYRHTKEKVWFWNGFYYYAPILDWDSAKVWKYIEEKGIPRNPLWSVKGHSSHDCVICIPYSIQRKEKWLWLKSNYPEIFEKLYTLWRHAQSVKKLRVMIDLDEVKKQATLF